MRRYARSLLVLTGVAALSVGAAAAAPVASQLLGHPPDSRQPTPTPTPTPTVSVSSTVPPPAARIVVIGDSLSTGLGTSPDMAWPNLVRNGTSGGKRPLAIVDAAVNGSGYVSQGDGGSTFLSQVDGSVQKTTQMVLVFGSENDMGTDGSVLKEAVSKTLAEISAKAPDAKIVVVGPPSYTNAPEPARLQVRDEDRAAATEAGAVFVDPIQEQWIMGHAEELIGPDGDHPSADGQHYLQETMEKIILANLPE
ncbi:lysophospholipase L1-like esterase [Arthrobacter oryzae]|uniref:Lysophospholipase L1-like esterase n=1 Tax=Arthrobacter oryzae TaxID=409290 RepID=A0A495FPX7_9MICC|nr:lysophospholipase L1-like esterase [Arthrobacter oryzae]